MTLQTTQMLSFMLPRIGGVFLLASLGFGAIGCSGGDSEAPRVELWFPPASGLMMVDTLTVRGAADDDSNIVAIRVNGVEAETSTGFSLWQAEVPLAAGANLLVIESEDAKGNIDSEAASVTITRAPFDVFNDAGAMALDQNARQMLLADWGESALYRYNLDTGDWVVLSANTEEYGPYWHGLTELELDLAHDRAVVIGSKYGGGSTMYSVDLNTGARTVIADEVRGQGIPLQMHRGLALDGERGRVIVISTSPPQPDYPIRMLVAVDLETGDRTQLSGDGIGSGPELSGPHDLVVDSSGAMAYVVDSVLQTVLSVDLQTLERRVVSGPERGAGSLPIMPRAMVLDAANNRVLVLDTLAGDTQPGYTQSVVLAIDLSTGDRTLEAELPCNEAELDCVDFEFDSERDEIIGVVGDVLAAVNLTTGERRQIGSTLTGTGEPLTEALWVTVDDAGNRAYITGFEGEEEEYEGGLFMEVDLATGNRRLVSGPGVGAGPELAAPVSIVIEEEHGRAFLADYVGKIVEVDLDTGDRAEVWDAHAVLPDVEFDIWVGGLVQYQDRLLVSMFLGSAICAVEPDTGKWELLAGMGAGTGPELEGPFGMDISDAHGLLFVADLIKNAIVAIDVITGERHEVSGDIGTGPLFDQPSSVVYDRMRDRLLVSDESDAGLYIVDIATGDRTAITVDGSIAQFDGSDTIGITLGRYDYSVLVVEHRLEALIAIDPLSGQMVVVSH